MKIIAKLALSRITSKKSRSAVICAAIFLTIVLFMTIVSISVNLLSGYSLMMRLSSGTDYHGYLRAEAFTLSWQELRDELKKTKTISESSAASIISKYSLDEEHIADSENYINAVEAEEALQNFYTDITEGNFPSSDSEILLNPLYFPDAEVGEKIKLYYTKKVNDSYSNTCAEFTVSGLILSRSDSQMKAVLRYSDTLEDTYCFLSEYLNVYFMFTNNYNISQKYDELINETLGAYRQPGYEKFGKLNPAFLNSYYKEALNPSNVFMIIFSAATVFLCSFLLIYNVYSIALTQDMQSFGLLNIIGTTHKQLKSMICVQSVILFAVTLPFGLTAGYFIGWKILSPLLFSVLANEGLKFEFNIWIPLATVILTLFTLLWSAVRPLKKLKSLTPIAAIDYSPAADLSARYIKKKNFNKKYVAPDAKLMAKYSVSRNLKKTVINAVSLSLSVILFMLVSTLCDYLIEYTNSNLQFSDYIVKLDYTYRYESGNDDYTTMFRADQGAGINVDYVNAVENSVYTDEVFKIRTFMTEMQTPQNMRSALGKLRNEYKFFEHYPELIQALKGNLDVLIVGIPDSLFPQIYISENGQLGKGYESGYAVYDGAKTGGITDKNGNAYDFSYFSNGDSVKLVDNSYRIVTSGVSSPTSNFTKWIDSSAHRAVLYITETDFIKEFGEGQTYALLVNAKADCYDFMRTELESLNAVFSVDIDDGIYDKQLSNETVEKKILGFSTGITGRMDGLNQMQSTVLSIRTVGYSLTIMIFLIGLLNVVNTALTSITERKREFAMLEAVGMTGRQMMQMLLGESIYSSCIAVLITVCVGFPLILLIINTAMDSIVALNWIFGAAMLALCSAVSILSGLAVFRLTKSSAVVERIKAE